MHLESYQEYIETIDLQRYWLVLKRRWLPAVVIFIASVAGATLYALSRESIYQATGKLVLQPDRSTALTGVGTEFSELKSLPASGGSPLVTQSAVIISSPVLAAAVKELDLTNSEGQPIPPQALRPNLEISQLEGADVLSVSYQSSNPSLSAAMVNAVMEAYIERNIIMNRSEATAAREFVEAQIPRAEAEVERAAEALRQFKSRNQIITLESEAIAAVDTLSRLDTQINQTTTDLANASAQVDELIRQLGISFDRAKDLEALSTAPGVQQALADLQAIQTELASQLSLYRSKHPIIINLERQKAALQQVLEERVQQIIGDNQLLNPGDLQMSELGRQLTVELSRAEIQRISLNQQLQALLDVRENYQKWADNFPDLEKQQLELRQRLDAAVKNYDALLSRLQDAQLAENQTVGTAEILEPAIVPPNPIGGAVFKYIGAGVVVGLMFGLAAAFFLDLVDKSIKTVKDGEALLGYTLLGLIPEFSFIDDSINRSSETAYIAAHRLVVFRHDLPMVVAAYQMLQANLKFTSSDKAYRALAITSAVSGEGKSEVCANLAASLTQAGKRVLLIDADMRQPSQHYFWNRVNQYGLSQLLVGEIEQQQAFQDCVDGLTLITSGVTPPNPLALLDSERMATLLKELTHQFDYVLIDTPPLLAAAEASVVGRLSDGVLMVMRPRIVDSASALAAKAILKRAGVQVLGMVANGVDIRNEHGDYVSQFRQGEYGYVGRRGHSDVKV